ncbi:MAG: hypothetical protein U1E65_12810 [Myxococcota bacterium]
MAERPRRGERAAAWGQDQRALAKALGLTIEEWLAALEQASQSGAGLTAAVVGAAMAGGLGLGVLDKLDAPKLLVRARALIDPRPPKVESPILAEAIRRADEQKPQGAGARLLRKKEERPQRTEQALLPSDATSTPDAPGEDT